jgi:hypothetical protein
MAMETENDEPRLEVQRGLGMRWNYVTYENLHRSLAMRVSMS